MNKSLALDQDKHLLKKFGNTRSTKWDKNFECITLLFVPSAWIIQHNLLKHIKKTKYNEYI